MMIVLVALGVVAGVLLGLLGGGGSILTVPLLKYVAGVEAKSAIAGSLLVVGVTAAFAMLPHARRGNVQWRVGLVFGAAGMVGAYGGGQIARYLPARLLLAAFALMMLAASIAMLRGRKAAPLTHAPRPLWRFIVEGAVVGLITGTIGAGGGFVIVPALVLLAGLPIAQAIGTSLLVIALNSGAGFLGHVSHTPIAWTPTLALLGAAIVGSFAGAALAARISADKLRRAFAVFVLVAGIAMLIAQW